MSSALAANDDVVVVDAGHGVGRVLAGLLAKRGNRVTGVTVGESSTSLPENDDRLRWIDEASINQDSSRIISSAKNVIFNISSICESSIIDNGQLFKIINDDLSLYMHRLQVIVRAMIERRHGQIWVLAPDDSFGYYISMPFSPIIHNARVGSIRALAKEIARFDVFANVVVLQPDTETIDLAELQANRAGVDSYAQRFKALSLDHVADTLAFWLGCPALPMNGSVLHFGRGVYDGNY